MAKNFFNRELKIRRLGVEESLWEDLYHRLLRLSWPRFFAVFLVVFLGLNSLFATAYLFFPYAIANIQPYDFGSCFAFSVQTLSTIGYGHFYPVTGAAHSIVALESATGMFFTAVLTGLVFAKFARPSARIVFSKNILWTTQNNKPVLAIRLGNIRTNRVFDGHATVSILRDETTSEGERLRRIVDLSLLRDKTPIFSMSWTLYHMIDETSPFYRLSLEHIRALNWELIVTFNGLDQELSQNIAAQNAYPADAIISARKFGDMIHLHDGVRVIDFSKLDDVERQLE